MVSTTRRQEILSAAMELFSGKGYHATSMRDIADRLGLQAGSLYVHIRGKEDLLYEIVDQAAERFLAAAEAAAAQALQSGAGADQHLRLAVRGHLAVMAENLDTATVFFHEWKFLDPERRWRIQAKRDAYEGTFRRIIASGVEAGLFRPLDTRIAGLAVLSMCNWFYHWYSPDGPLTADQIADRFVDLLLAGLYPGPAAPVDVGASAAREAIR